MSRGMQNMTTARSEMARFNSIQLVYVCIRRLLMTIYTTTEFPKSPTIWINTISVIINGIGMTMNWYGWGFLHLGWSRSSGREQLAVSLLSLKGKSEKISDDDRFDRFDMKSGLKTDKSADVSKLNVMFVTIIAVLNFFDSYNSPFRPNCF